jgi:hemolysin activation/secretion protein
MNVQGQWTTKNLISFEDISLGGPYAVRAYPVGEATGDQGWYGNIELRYLVNTPKDFIGYLQLSGFYDRGTVHVNSNNSVNGVLISSPNIISLPGWGVGATWSNPADFNVNVSYAWKIGNYINVAGMNQPGQLWINASKSF